jgi:hypothetical protein
MTVQARGSAAVALGVLAFLCTPHSEAQPTPSVFIDIDGALSGADHYVELHRDTITVDSTWVLAEGILEGHQVPLVPPLPSRVTIESDRLVTVRDARREVVALRPTRTLFERERVPIRISLPRDRGLGLATLPIPTPRARSIQRVRFGRGVRFEVGEETPLSVAAGIQVGRGIGHRARRRADTALDGPHAHRRVGALYVLSDSDGLEGRLYSASEHRAGLTLFAAALFLLSAAGVYRVYRRAQRAVDRERVDAYLASQVAPQEAREWGITANASANDESASDA